MRFSLIAAQHPGDIGNWPNLGFGYIASYLRQHVSGVETQVAFNFDELAEQKPDLIGISSVSQNYNEALRLVRRIKDGLNVPVIIGGVHITALPATLPPEASLAVLGEGEETTAELISLFIGKGKFDPADLADVRGIAYRETPAGPLRIAPRRPLISRLDDLPHPDREVLRYRGEDTYLFTSRGCPYNCSFCSSRVHWEGKLRCFSAEYVTEELRELWERYGTRRAHFYDDLFVADRKRLERMAELWRHEAWHGKVAFSCAVRAEAVDRDLARMLKEMNFIRATFGAESQCPRILRQLKGKTASPEANQRAVDLLAAEGIGMTLSFIKGTPTETREELEMTYRFITSNLRRRKIDGAETGLLVPFPGTKTWDDACRMGLAGEQMDWSLLRNPCEGLIMNPEARRYAAWDFLYTAKIAELEEFCSWETTGIVQDMAGPLTAGLVEQLMSVRNVTQWIIPDALKIALPEGDCRKRLLFDTDAEKRWAEPARKRIRLRVTLKALEHPDALDGLVWHLYEHRLPAVVWRDNGRFMADAVGPLPLASADGPDCAAYEPGASPLDIPDGIPIEPSVPSLLAAATRRAVALAATLRDRDNRLMALWKQIEERTSWGQALNRELELLRSQLLALQQDVQEKAQWGIGLDKELQRARERILALQQEVDEKNRWALALDKELRAWRAGEVRSSGAEDK